MDDFSLNINNTECSESIYQIDTITNNIKGGNINVNQIKIQCISFNEKIKSSKSPRDGRIS